MASRSPPPSKWAAAGKKPPAKGKNFALHNVGVKTAMQAAKASIAMSSLANVNWQDTRVFHLHIVPAVALMLPEKEQELQHITVEVTGGTTVGELKETLAKELEVLPERLLLAKLPGKERLFDNEKTLGDCGVGDHAGLCFIDFTPLRQEEAYCPIELTQERAITLAQLHHLMEFMRSLTDPDTDQICCWWDQFTGSPTCGQQMSFTKINLYQANDVLIKPATQANACSFVELIAMDGKQPPTWFTSHFWGEAIADFVACVSAHAKRRSETDATAYWVCAYANNQHNLGKDLSEDPRESSFFKAMRVSLGVLLILDEAATPFKRIWCCFEESVALTDTSRPERMLLDMATREPSGEVYVLTDGLTHAEEMAETKAEGRGWLKKAEIEANFPVSMVRQGLTVDVQDAQASVDADRIRILNSIAGCAVADLSTPLPEQPDESRLAKYEEVNAGLRARFAIAGWRASVQETNYLSSRGQGIGQKARAQDAYRMSEAMAEALSSDTLMTELHLCFAGLDFSDADVHILARALPPNLKDLGINCGGCKRVGDEGLLELTEIPRSIVSLSLHFTKCMAVTDRGICNFLKKLSRSVRLQTLSLAFQETAFGDGGAAAIADLLGKNGNAKALDLNFEKCMKITRVGITKIAAALPQTLLSLKLNIGNIGQLERREGEIFYVSDLTDRTFESIVNKFPRCLTSLKLNCEGSQVGDTSVIKLSQFQELEELELIFRRCTKLRNKGISEFVLRLPNGLKSFRIDLAKSGAPFELWKKVSSLPEARKWLEQMTGMDHSRYQDNAAVRSSVRDRAGSRGSVPRKLTATGAKLADASAAASPTGLATTAADSNEDGESDSDDSDAPSKKGTHTQKKPTLTLTEPVKLKGMQGDSDSGGSDAEIVSHAAANSSKPWYLNEADGHMNGNYIAQVPLFEYSRGQQTQRAASQKAVGRTLTSLSDSGSDSDEAPAQVSPKPSFRTPEVKPQSAAATRPSESRAAAARLPSAPPPQGSVEVPPAGVAVEPAATSSGRADRELVDAATVRPVASLAAKGDREAVAPVAIDEPVASSPAQSDRENAAPLAQVASLPTVNNKELVVEVSQPVASLPAKPEGEFAVQDAARTQPQAGGPLRRSMTALVQPAYSESNSASRAAVVSKAPSLPAAFQKAAEGGQAKACVELAEPTPAFNREPSHQANTAAVSTERCHSLPQEQQTPELHSQRVSKAPSLPAASQKPVEGSQVKACIEVLEPTQAITREPSGQGNTAEPTERRQLLSGEPQISRLQSDDRCGSKASRASRTSILAAFAGESPTPLQALSETVATANSGGAVEGAGDTVKECSSAVDPASTLQPLDLTLLPSTFPTQPAAPKGDQLLSQSASGDDDTHGSTGAGTDLLAWVRRNIQNQPNAGERTEEQRQKDINHIKKQRAVVCNEIEAKQAAEADRRTQDLRHIQEMRLKTLATRDTEEHSRRQQQTAEATEEEQKRLEAQRYVLKQRGVAMKENQTPATTSTSSTQDSSPPSSPTSPCISPLAEFFMKKNARRDNPASSLSPAAASAPNSRFSFALPGVAQDRSQASSPTSQALADFFKKKQDHFARA
eukprot:TRINITY_DN24742_c0_g1_i1.p1 TRINITY_DN24742_c0_g1~~TRINITY_DN24742_c0_g1_i1.p1  ORF type:complete len:1583 (-),score=319.19 TRINITY_DN24742_c0_g1_i1:130-4878(-)